MRRALLLLPLICFCGCMRVKTDPIPLFSEVQEEIECRSGEVPCWDRCQEVNIEALLSRELTPECAVYIALLNNRALQATFEELGIAQAQFAQTGLLRNPIFSLSYRFSTRSSVTDLIDLDLFQNVLEALLIPLKKRAACHDIEATKARVCGQILELIAETKMAFFTLQGAQEALKLTKLSLLAADASLDASRRLFKAGNRRAIDVSVDEKRYLEAKLAVASREMELLEARENLNVLMGLWGTQIDWRIAEGLPQLFEIEPEWGDVENRAVSTSFDLKAARESLSTVAASFGIDTTRLIFPQFDVGPSAERDESVWFVGPAFALGMPLFDFGQAQAAAAHSEILRLWNLYTALAIDVRSTARMARLHVMDTHRRSLYYKKVLLPAVEEVTAQTLLQHNAMQMGVFELLNAKRAEIEAHIEAVALLRDYWIARSELELILNGRMR